MFDETDAPLSGQLRTDWQSSFKTQRFFIVYVVMALYVGTVAMMDNPRLSAVEALSSFILWLMNNVALWLSMGVSFLLMAYQLWLVSVVTKSIKKGRSQDFQKLFGLWAISQKMVRFSRYVTYSFGCLVFLGAVCAVGTEQFTNYVSGFIVALILVLMHVTTPLVAMLFVYQGTLKRIYERNVFDAFNHCPYFIGHWCYVSKKPIAINDYIMTLLYVVESIHKKSKYPVV